MFPGCDSDAAKDLSRANLAQVEFETHTAPSWRSPGRGGSASSTQLESDYAHSTAPLDVMTSTRFSSATDRPLSIRSEHQNTRRLPGRSFSSVNSNPPPDEDTQHPAISEEISEIKRYEDFTTIDWVQDAVYEQNSRRADWRTGGGFWNKEGVFGWRRKVYESYDAGQAWLVVTLVGIAIGLNSAVLNIITEWLSDIKLGHCTSAFYLNEQFCCWGAEGGTFYYDIDLRGILGDTDHEI